MNLVLNMILYSLTSTIIMTIAFAFLLGYSTEIWAQSQEVLRKYENPNLGTRFSYPSYWGILEEEEDCVQETSCNVASPVQGQQFNDFLFRASTMSSDHWEIQEHCKCDTLLEYVQYIYKETERVYTDGFRFINDSQFLIGNKYPAWRIEYSAKLSPEAEYLARTSVLSLNNNTFYRFTLTPLTNTSYGLHLPEFNKIIESVEFVQISKTTPKTPSFLNSSEIPSEGTDSLSTIPSVGTGLSSDDSSTIRILSHNSFTDSLGFLHIVGELQNEGITNLEFVKVTSTLYDARNQVVATDFTYTDPSDVGPGQKAPFEIIVTSASIPLSQIDHYTLTGSYSDYN